MSCFKVSPIPTTLTRARARTPTSTPIPTLPLTTTLTPTWKGFVHTYYEDGKAPLVRPRAGRAELDLLLDQDLKAQPYP